MLEQSILFTCSFILIMIGLYSIIYSRNLIKTMMSFQVLVFGVNLALFTNSLGGELDLFANTLVLFSILVGASVEAVGLALVIQLYRKYGSLDPYRLRRLKQ